MRSDPELEQWRVVLLRDPCVYCGGVATGLDHIHPRHFGGGDRWENRAPACGACDNDKGTTSLLVFVLARQRGIAKAGRRHYRSSAHRVAAARALQRNIAEQFYRGNIRIPAALRIGVECQTTCRLP